MAIEHRVLPSRPISSLDEYVAQRGGGRGLDAARSIEPDVVIAEISASGLRGRGGAGFPTGMKWRTVRDNRSDAVASTVVVNAAEGEPGTFKDRTILRTNPYHVLEGALIAALAVEAGDVVVALKETFTTEIARLRAAIDEIDAAGWTGGLKITVFEGPGEYLYGEETALLEALDGRAPLPRIAPPFRRGAIDVVDSDDDVRTESGLPAHVDMSGPTDDQLAPAALVDNVETLANVPGIVARGAAWFREMGTTESPGTIVCTVVGGVRHPGVGEVAMGTTLHEAIVAIGGGLPDGRTIVGLLPGVSNALIPAAHLDTPLTYEAMAAAGSGLGSAGFIVLDDTTDPVAVAAGASRFLAVESCGQCTPCKQDGLALSELLASLARSDANEDSLAAIREGLATVTDGARCNLAAQQQVIVQSLLEHFPGAVEAHLRGTADPVAPMVVAELIDVRDGEAIVDIRHEDKQPDWTFDDEDSGEAPADRLAEHRA